MQLTRYDNGWIRCGKCGHKLGRTVGEWAGGYGLPAIETKCHSCGTLNYIMVGRKKEVNDDK